MPSKRAAESDGESYSDYIKDEPNDTAPSTPRSKAQRGDKRIKTTPSPAKSPISNSTSGDKSLKAIFGEMIVLAGIRSLSKAEIYAAVSLIIPCCAII